jgi:hypothetical protein
MASNTELIPKEAVEACPNLIWENYSYTYGLNKSTNNQKYKRWSLSQNRSRRLRGWVVVWLYFGTGWRWIVNATPRPLCPRERDPVPILLEVAWTPEPVWMGAENLASTGIQSPDRPADGESLYWLSYPGPPTKNLNHENVLWPRF